MTYSRANEGSRYSTPPFAYWYTVSMIHFTFTWYHSVLRFLLHHYLVLFAFHIDLNDLSNDIQLLLQRNSACDHWY